MFDREILFQMLANKEWESIAKIMYENANLIKSDPVFAQATKLFESEFFAKTDLLSGSEKKKVYQYPWQVIELRKHGFSQAFVDNFVDRYLLLLKENNHPSLLNYASQHQDRPIAVKILEDIQAKSPEMIADMYRQNVSIKATSTVKGRQKITKLFKSRQEQSFFEAAREAFPTYHPYPNVAISCIIDYSAIESDLTVSEREYFFKAIVDCVIFDSSKDYEPKFFIELDSVFHDNKRAIRNDQMKNRIFEVANAKLIRIRANDHNETTTEKFKQLILEVMRGN